MNQNPLRKKIWLLAGCGFGLVSGFLVIALLVTFAVKDIFVNIQPDERAIVLSMYESAGYRSEVLGPGMHFLRPGESTFIYNLGRQTYEMRINEPPDFIAATTSNGLNCEVDVSITYAVDPDQVLDLYKYWRNSYRDNLIRPQSRSITRSVFAQYSYNDSKNKRPEIQNVITDQLAAVLAENSLILEEFTILEVRRAAN